MTTVCKHGQLARSCEICDLERELTRAQNKYIELVERDNSLLDEALRERDAAVKFIHVIGEELILRGYPGGDRDVILANIRLIPPK